MIFMSKNIPKFTKTKLKNGLLGTENEDENSMSNYQRNPGEKLANAMVVGTKGGRNPQTLLLL